MYNILFNQVYRDYYCDSPIACKYSIRDAGIDTLEGLFKVKQVNKHRDNLFVLTAQDDIHLRNIRFSEEWFRFNELDFTEVTSCKMKDGTKATLYICDFLETKTVASDIARAVESIIKNEATSELALNIKDAVESSAVETNRLTGCDVQSKINELYIDILTKAESQISYADSSIAKFDSLKYSVKSKAIINEYSNQNKKSLQSAIDRNIAKNNTVDKKTEHKKEQAER